MKKAIITLLFAAASIIVVDAQVMPEGGEIPSPSARNDSGAARNDNGAARNDSTVSYRGLQAESISSQNAPEEAGPKTKVGKWFKEALGRLTVGGYGEVAFSQNFYSDNMYRYSNADAHKHERHGRVDIPHAVIFLGYDFGKGWSMQTEVEFEHTGTGSAVEREFEEAGEWEKEIEKGGEVALEQFWIQKSIFPELNIRVGQIVVPVGALNNAHEPLNYFTVYRPEGEYTIMPSTWHDTGISIWGEIGKKKWMRYEVLLIPSLDGFMFDRDHFVKYGSYSPYEFRVSNKYAVAARLDFKPVTGLRLSASGYYGQAMGNTYPNEEFADKYKVPGHTVIGAFDFVYKSPGNNIIARGNADYGYLSDAWTISYLKRNRAANNAPYKKSTVGKGAMAFGAEFGGNVLYSKKDPEQKLYLFGRYEYYNSYIPAANQNAAPWTGRHRIAFGINYVPLPYIAVKAEYSHRFLKSDYNNEPSISFGIVYMAFFNRK